MENKNPARSRVLKSTIRILPLLSHAGRQPVFPALGSIPWPFGHVLRFSGGTTGCKQGNETGRNEQKRFEFSHNVTLEQNLVAFHDFILLPFGKDVGYRAVWLDGGDLDFANQFTITVDQHLCTR